MSNDPWLLKFLSEQRETVQFLTLIGCTALVWAFGLLKIQTQLSSVPISALTFITGLLALSIGGSRAALVLIAYVMIRLLISPLFSSGSLSLRPESGYLIGMVFSSFLVGRLSEEGIPKTFVSTLLVLYAGSAVVLAWGAVGVSVLVPLRELLAKAVMPFVIGDFIKNALAALTFLQLTKWFRG